MNDKNTLMLGTRKGLVTYERGPMGWKLNHTSFLGIPVSLTHVDSRNGTWWACLDHGHWGQKLHRSKDQGKTWTDFRAGLPQTDCYDIVFRHALDVQGDTLSFGTTTGNLFLSNDQGAHWECISSTLPMIYSLAFV